MYLLSFFHRGPFPVVRPLHLGNPSLSLNAGRRNLLRKRSHLHRRARSWCAPGRPSLQNRWYILRYVQLPTCPGSSKCCRRGRQNRSENIGKLQSYKCKPCDVPLIELTSHLLTSRRIPKRYTTFSTLRGSCRRVTSSRVDGNHNFLNAPWLFWMVHNRHCVRATRQVSQNPNRVHKAIRCFMNRCRTRRLPH